MHNLILFCKSFRNDLDRIKILKNSIDKYNKDKIPFYISCPKVDVELFKKTLGEKTYHIITDEEIIGEKEQSWINQQLVKLNFYKTKIAKNYVILDSDSYFIRDFYIKDFMYDKDTPFTICHQSKGINTLKSAIVKKDVDSKTVENVKHFFNNKFPQYCFGPSSVIFSSVVLKKMDAFLKGKGLTFEKLINKYPSEFNCYGEYLLQSNAIKFVPIDSIFKFYSFEFEYQIDRKLGITEKDLAKNYLGIVMQNGWVRDTKFKTSLLGKVIKRYLVLLHHFYKDKRYSKLNYGFRIKTLEKCFKYFIRKPLSIILKGRE